MHWIGGIWVAAILLLGCARVRADEPTGWPAVEAPASLSPRAVAQSAVATEQATASDRDEWRREQRRARFTIAAGAGLAASGFAHLAIAGRKDMRECGDRPATMSLVPAGLIAGVGTVLVMYAVPALRWSIRDRGRFKASEDQKAGAVGIALASLAVTQGALWGLWTLGMVAAC